MFNTLAIWSVTGVQSKVHQFTQTTRDSWAIANTVDSLHPHTWIEVPSLSMWTYNYIGQIIGPAAAGSVVPVSTPLGHLISYMI